MAWMRLKSLQCAWHKMNDVQKQAIEKRVSYYNKLSSDFDLPNSVKPYSELKLKGHASRYYFDMMDILTLFPDKVRVDYLFGDITEIPASPVLLKSRPIENGNQNAVLMPFNRLRHFRVFKDDTPFNQKKSACVWRGNATQRHRIDFLDRFHNVNGLDVGCTGRQSSGKPYHKGFMSVKDQLQYKYILSIEGNDVATNLKWIMHSNSLCFMRAPKFETWFQEGVLKPNIHYVQLKDDYSDLCEKMEFYNARPHEAQVIIANAQSYFRSFMNPDVEDITVYKVIQSYLLRSAQLDEVLFDGAI